MNLTWVREETPVWDDDKKRVFSSLPSGVLPIAARDGEALPGDWFAASDGEGVAGYGWLDVTWGGDAEVVFVVDSGRQGRGVGGYVMTQIEAEAARRGINYVYNTVPRQHPQRDAVHDWLLARGYEGNETDDSLRKHVRADAAAPEAPAAPAESVTMPDDAMPPGHEESGGYVSTEQHRY